MGLRTWVRDDRALPTGTRVRQRAGGRRWGTIEAFDRATMMYGVGYDDGAWEVVAWADVRWVRGGLHHAVLERSRAEAMVASQWAERSEKFLHALAEAYNSKKEMEKP